MKSEPLLQIELDQYESVPKVFYKGKEITNKVKVLFDWKTDDERARTLPEIQIEYIEVDKNKEAKLRKIVHDAITLYHG